jgi:hypothetical protein
MFQLLVSTMYLPLFAASGSLTVDWAHPEQTELIKLFSNTVKVVGACGPGAVTLVGEPPLVATCDDVVCVPSEGA